VPGNDASELPGGEILTEGLRDLRRGVESVPALLLLIARPRLERLGIEIARGDDGPDAEFELALYRLLCARAGADAYGQYNAWLRRLASLCHALEARAERERAA
jgi:hypothetical protein